ncbi:hypothetical protein [Klebsiella sp. RIT-PI-d]|uniref:hypothetical protein n=1 Tax=Klebsiella sp. RIT-PI-d TaxID=1681196 RepID=UPI001D1792D6|nr:hypothetical protein [Klebsiella sp. RIT-PI-d]
MAAEKDSSHHSDNEELAEQVRDHPGQNQQQETEADRQHPVSLNKSHDTLDKMHDNHVRKNVRYELKHNVRKFVTRHKTISLLMAVVFSIVHLACKLRAGRSDLLRLIM